MEIAVRQKADIHHVMSVEEQREAAVRWAEVSKHRERLVLIASRRVGGLGTAEDCVHEAMIRCVEFRDLDLDRVGPFLTSVLMRICVDVHRAKERQGRAVQRLRFLPDEDFESDLCDHDLARHLSFQISELPEREQEVLRLRAAGLTADETARHIGVSYRAASSALTRARHRMRVCLEEAV